LFPRYNNGERHKVLKKNSSPEDFGALLKHFADRLSRCVHEVKAVVHGIEKAIKYVDDNLTCKTTNMITKKEERTLFLHWQYHPKDITRQNLRRIYDETLAEISGFEKMTIYYSHPRDLREALTRT
jgi:hypothetical protein